MTKRIVIVDDSASCRAILVGVIEGNSEDWIIDQCDSGKEALKIAESKDVHAYSVDLIMPDMDGIELSKKIRKNDPQAKIVMMTGDTSAHIEVVAEALKIKILHKPLRDDVLNEWESFLVS